MQAPQDLHERAQGREVDAQFALARALLSSGESRQSEFHRAVAMVDAAADAGHAGALEMRALFEAVGAARPQSWGRAFDTLQAAAERGSPTARRQLVLLADPSVQAPVPGDAGTACWGEVRERISLDRLMRHPERQALCNAPRIRALPGFASPAECRWLIDRARTMLKPALVFDAGGRHVADPGRSNSGTDFQLADMDLVIAVIRARMAAATRIPVAVFEPTQLLHYAAGQEFKHHVDFLEPDNAHHREQIRSHGQRIATFLIYLNGDFDGGETQFARIGIRFRGNAGDAIFWPNVDMEGRPDPLTLHAGLPPTSGEKWLLSQWIRDKAPPAQ